MGNSNPSNGQEKAVLEKEWANAEARLKLGQDDKSVWSALRHTIRTFAYYDKIFVVWALIKGEPVIRDVFTVQSVDATFQGGLWIKASGKISGHEAVITQTPQRLAPGLDIFAWVPYFNELRYASGDWSNYNLPRHLRSSVCLKMRHDPEDRFLGEGVVCITEMHLFRQRFPQYSQTRF